MRRPLTAAHSTAADMIDEVAMMRRGAVLIGMLNPLADRAQIDQYAAHGLAARNTGEIIQAGLPPRR